MQYKSARPCFNIFFDQKVFVGAVAFAVSLFAANFARATMTVTPLSKINFSTLFNTANSAYYYPIFYTPGSSTSNGLASPPTGIAQSGVLDPNFSFLDLSQDPNPAGNMQTESGVLLFNVISTATSTTQEVLAATMLDTNNTLQFVPIIGWGTNNVLTGCSGSSGCLSAGANARNTDTNFYYGVYYTPGQTFQIAVSPTAFCESLNITSLSSTGCGQSFFSNTGTGGASQQMLFNFVVIPASSVPTNLSYTTAVPTSTNDSIAVTLDFVSLNPNPISTTNPTPSPTPSPTLNCNLADGVISPQPGGFDLQEPQNFTLQNDPTNTVGQLIAVAIPSPGPLNATVNNYTSNPVVDYSLQVPGIGEYFGSFTPSTSTSATYYDLGFLAEDPAGFIIDDGGGSGTCTFPGVFSTAVVNGFLQQSQCFIATAAFRDLNTTPLVLLRSFRDHFLEHFALGRSFVHWYYAWSPSAAEWLIDHPVFRFPVLLALIPLQTFAWLVLHPMMLIVLLFIGASMILWGTLLRRSTE